jgi:hypothetical protein
VDNSPEAVTQGKMKALAYNSPPQVSANSPIVQMKQAELDMVESDMSDIIGARNVFNLSTLSWLDGLLIAARGGREAKNLTGAQMANEVYPAYRNNIKKGLEAGRDNINYKKILGTNLTALGAEALITWLGNNASDKGKECMYVHVGGVITGDAIAHNAKIFHPNLLGGDPDVTCAGTLEFTAGDKGAKHTLIVTNESGHFKPGDVAAATLSKFGEILGALVTINGKPFVKEVKEDELKQDALSVASDDAHAQAGSDVGSVGSLQEPEPEAKPKPKAKPKKATGFRKTAIGLGTTASGLTYPIY